MTGFGLSDGIGLGLGGGNVGASYVLDNNTISGLTVTFTDAGSNINVGVSGDAAYNGTYPIAKSTLDLGLPVNIVLPTPVESPANTWTASNAGLWIYPSGDPAIITKHWLYGSTELTTGAGPVDFTSYSAYDQTYRETATNGAGAVNADNQFFTTTVLAPADIIGLGPWAYWTLDDLAYVFQGPGATNVVTASGQTVALIQDRSGNSRNAAQTTASAEPEYNVTSSIKSLYSYGTSTATDSIGFTGAGPADFSIFFAVKTSDTTAVLVNGAYAAGSNFAGAFDGTGGAIFSNAGASPSCYVDNSLVSTRSALKTAAADGSWHIVELRGLDASAWSGIWPGGYNASGFEYTGYFGPDIILIETSAFTDSDRTNTIIPYLQQGVGL